MSLSNILQRLPLHRQLTGSQSALLKLSPLWDKWASANLAKEFVDEISLTNYQSGKLSLVCSNATCASQLKHQQTSLLVFLNQSGVGEVEKLHIRVRHPSHSSDIFDSQTNHETNNQNSSISSTRKSLPQKSENDDIGQTKASEPSIKSIENCKKTISNERLAESLTKLAETLKKQD